MGTRVMLRMRRNQRGSEALIIRGDKIITVLPEGDPLRYLLRLPEERLRAMRSSLIPLLESRPQLKEILDAIIEYKEITGAEEAPDA